MKKILLIGNHCIVIYNFRLEFIETLLKKGFEVHVAIPYGDRVSELESMGCQVHDTPLERHGLNIFHDGQLFLQYLYLLKKIKPDIVFTYTIKPNIYGTFACQIKKINCVPTVTGLGCAIKNNTILSKLVIILYRIAFKKAQTVFFQNAENYQFFINHNIDIKQRKLVMGSGVNLEKYILLDYPQDRITKFVFIGRVMKEKGIDEYIDAAKYLKNQNINVEFHVCGFIEKEYQSTFYQYKKSGLIIYHGLVSDIRTILRKIHCVVLPSYHEGMSNALLEAAACGRPLLASNISGCKEIIDDSINGYLFEPHDVSSLINKIQKFLSLSYSEKKLLGLNSRKKVEKTFDRKKIINTYVEEIENVTI